MFGSADIQSVFSCRPRVLCCLTEHYFLFLIFLCFLFIVNEEHLVFTLCCLPSRGPPPSLRPPNTLPLQLLLQGWEQPHWTVSHQFCACRLLQTSRAALAHCTACGSPFEFQLCCWAELQAVQWRGFTLESAVFFLLCCCFLFSFPSPLSVLLSSGFFLPSFDFWRGHTKIFWNNQ